MTTAREALRELVRLHDNHQRGGFVDSMESIQAWAAAHAVLSKPDPAAQQWPKPEPVREPVARMLHWIGPVPRPGSECIARTFAEYPVGTDGNKAYWAEGAPLYAAPPAPQPAELLMHVCPGCGMEYADSKLHDANVALARLQKAQPAPSVEPVAYRHLHDDGWEYYDAPTGDDCKDCQALYAAPQAPQPSVPLSDEHAAELLGFVRGVHFDAPGLSLEEFSQWNKDRVRLVKLGWNAAHGIKSEGE